MLQLKEIKLSQLYESYKINLIKRRYDKMDIIQSSFNDGK